MTHRPNKIGVCSRLLIIVHGLTLCFGIAMIRQPLARAQSASGAIVDDASLLDPGEMMRITDGELRQFAFSPDETILAVATSAGLWIYAPSEAGNGEILVEEPARSLWWAADSIHLAVALDDGSLQLWQMTDRELLGTVDGTAGAIVTAAWSPDANQVATGSIDGVIELWSVSEGVVLETLEGHTGSVVDLYWITDGSQIVSAAEDGSVRVWGVEVAIPPTPTPTPAPTAIPVTVTVQVDRLNVRSGPGTDFPRVATGLRGEELIVLDQEDQCAWLQVRIPDGTEGWVAGTAQYVALAEPCESIGQMPTATPAAPSDEEDELLPEPTATPTTSAATPTPSASITETVESTETPVVLQAADETPADPFPPGQGCYLFQNGLPAPLSVTIVGTDNDFTQTIELTANEEAPFCFDPGVYQYTVRYQVNPDTAAVEIPGELTVQAGERFLFPIQPQE
jgi:hypothetical protein